MSATTGLPAPGVEVIQVFQTTAPTVITPTLNPVVVGPCVQVVDAVIQSATGGNVINTGAQVEVPAFFVVHDAGNTPLSLSGDFAFQSSGLPLLTVNFAAGTYTPAQIVAAIQAALTAVGESDLVVETIPSGGFRVRTINEDEHSTLVIDASSSGGILTTFGLVAGAYYQGESGYRQYQITIPTASFPNPNNNIAQLAFEVDTVRAFLGLSGNSVLQEELRTQTVLRHGGASTVIDAGNGTSFSPILQMAGEDFTATSPVAAEATVTGSAAPTLGSLSNKTLIMSDGRVPITIALGTITVLSDLEAVINAAFNPLDGIVASASGADLVLTSTRLREDGVTSAKGEDSQIVILGGTALNPANLLDSGGTPTIKIGRIAGKPMAVKPGDQVWIDGVMVGTVTQVAPNGNHDQLKINANLSTTFTGNAFYIEAVNLTAGSTTRPRPDLTVDGDGNATFKHGLLRDTTGTVVESIQANTALIEPNVGMFISYKALRLDVTQASTGSTPGLLQFSDPTVLQQQLSPITTDNPLGLGLFFAMLNAPGTQITGLGVDAVSDEEPFGTVDAYTRAATFLEQFEVYAIAPLTHEPTVHQVFQTHVDTMSAPDQKGERIVLVNPSRPARFNNTLVASGTNGNTVGGGGLTFDTGIPNLGALLLAQGINPATSIPVSANLFLNISASASNFNVSAVSGSVLTLNDTFTGSQNVDGFFGTSPMSVPQIEEPFSLQIRGAPLVLTDGITPDKANIAATYAAIGKGFGDRRVWMTVPDTCAALISGVQQQIDGFYMNAAIAGMIGGLPPQQSFTNYPMAGFTQVIGSNTFFTPLQMNQMAAGGCYIILQDVAGISPLYSRMALTTDLTSVETRTDSITKVVDFVAKFLRTGLKNFIGRFNITQGLLDSMGHVLEGLKTFLIENGVLIGMTVNNIIQDTTEPDQVLIDVTLDPPFPCNYVRLTLVI